MKKKMQPVNDDFFYECYCDEARVGLTGWEKMLFLGYLLCAGMVMLVGLFTIFRWLVG